MSIKIDFFITNVLIFLSSLHIIHMKEPTCLCCIILQYANQLGSVDELTTVGSFFLGVIMNIKDPTTVEEQLNIFKSRKLRIEDESLAKKFLLNVNYYRLSGYTYMFLKEDVFQQEASFNEILKIYNSDKILRMILFKYIAIIEIELKTHITYELTTSMRSAITYLDFSEDLYFNENHHKDFIKRLDEQKEKCKDKLFIRHHKEKYNNILPLWVATEILSFGDISKYYSNLKSKYSSLISKYYYDIDDQTLKSWFTTIAYLRNTCAHHNRLYKTKLKPYPKSYRNFNFNNGHIADAIIIIGILLKKEDRKNYILDINNFINENNGYLFTSKSAYGLDKNKYSEMINIIT